MRVFWSIRGAHLGNTCSIYSILHVPSFMFSFCFEYISKFVTNVENVKSKLKVNKKHSSRVSLGCCHVVTCGATQRGQFDIHNGSSKERPNKKDDAKCLHVEGWGNVCAQWKEVMRFDHSTVTMFTVGLQSLGVISILHIIFYCIWHLHIGFWFNDEDPAITFVFLYPRPSKPSIHKKLLHA